MPAIARAAVPAPAEEKLGVLDAALEDLEEEAATVPTFCVCGSTDEPKVSVRCRGRNCRAGGLLHRYCAGLGADESASRDWAAVDKASVSTSTVCLQQGLNDVIFRDLNGLIVNQPTWLHGLVGNGLKSGHVI